MRICAIIFFCFLMIALVSAQDHPTGYDVALARIREADELGRRELTLAMLDLREVPPEIGNLSNLTTLYLNDNALTSLPPEIGNLSNLTVLHLNDNALTSLPPEIGNLSNLTTLYLNNNALTSLPPEIGNLGNLHQLVLSENLLTTLPPEIANLSALCRLSLANNEFQYLPTEIGQLEGIDEDYCHIDLNDNPLIFPPQNIIEQGTSAVLLYLRTHSALGLRQESLNTSVSSTPVGTGLDVIAFDVQPRQIQTGDEITITWDVRNVEEICLHIRHDYARNWTINCNGETIHAAQGSLTMQVTDEHLNALTIYLVPAETRNLYYNSTIPSIEIEVDIVCQRDWIRFPYVVDPSHANITECPLEAGRQVSAAYQSFENGFMLWFEGKIFVVSTNSNGINNYISAVFGEDTWQGESFQIPENPPEGLFLPQRGFGWFWYNQMYQDYNWLGWATSPEQAYLAELQVAEAFMQHREFIWFDPSYIISLPNQDLIYLHQAYTGYKVSYIVGALLYSHPSVAVGSSPTASPSPTATSSTLSPSDTVCEDAPVSRLAVGDLASVTLADAGETKEDLRVRSEPNGERIGAMPEGTQFYIVDGPTCMNGLLWWEIETLDASLRGWSAEGIAPDDYFMQPEN